MVPSVFLVHSTRQPVSSMHVCTEWQQLPVRSFPDCAVTNKQSSCPRENIANIILAANQLHQQNPNLPAQSMPGMAKSHTPFAPTISCCQTWCTQHSCSRPPQSAARGLDVVMETRPPWGSRHLLTTASLHDGEQRKPYPSTIHPRLDHSFVHVTV